MKQKVLLAAIVLLATTALLLEASQALAQSSQGDANASARWHVIVNDEPAPAPEIPVDADSPPLPLDIAVDIEPGSATAGRGIRIYGDDAGRVRTSADTRSFRDISRGWAELNWSKSFQQNGSNDAHTYSVNPTLLEYLGGREAAFRFAVHYECFETRDALNEGRALWRREAIFQRSRIGKRANDDSFFHSEGRFNGVEASPGPLPIDRQILSSVDGQVNENVFRTTKALKGAIDLTDCGIGKFNRVAYLLRIGFAERGPESAVAAFLGDPLETGEEAVGFGLTPMGTPAEGDGGGFCAGDLDRTRYAVNGDGTVTDRETGLMWQRCPLGASFSDSGTGNILGDDSCTGDGAPLAWGATLQAAADDNFAGHDNWRLPNIKELESLTELACVGPAIAPGIFPATPRRPFWSATPDALNGMAAKGIDANQGSVRSFGKEATIHARLVRDTGDQPLAPPIRIDVASGVSAEEGEDLVFPLRLSRPPRNDLTLEYRTVDRSAVADSDYSPAGGRIVIPAGAMAAEIGVRTLDDDTAEQNEVLEIELTAVSANAYIVDKRSSGEIVDDEPRITVIGVPQYEGTRFGSAMLFPVLLDRPASSEIRFEFTTIDGTARAADGDYVSTGGTVVIDPGKQFNFFAVELIDDDLVEGDEQFEVAFALPEAGNALLGERRISARIVDNETTLFELNDSGFATCANDSSLGASCPQSGFPRQDGDVGLDPTLNNDSDGHAGMRLTKLDGNGDPLADQSVGFEVTPWACVTDTVTGRMWEVKTDDDGLRDRDWRYTWYNSTGRNDGGLAGVEDGGACSGARCDTEGYVAAVNAAGLCGFSDWRAPTREELLSLDTNLPGGDGLDSNFFPFARASAINIWWTATPVVPTAPGEAGLVSDRAWAAFVLDEVNVNATEKRSPHHLRVVRNTTPIETEK